MALMSFPLGSLRGDGAPRRRPAPAPPARRRWRRKAWLFVGGLAWLLFLLAMVTHDAADPAFTTSGSGEPVRNRVGLLGARVSDMALFLFGFSAWWLVPVALRAWLSSLATVLRTAPSAATRRRAGASGSGWRCCWRPVARWSGRGCTASRRTCPAMPAACSAGHSGRCRCAGWVLPARACCGSRSAWPARRWRCASRGWASPRPSASASTRLRERLHGQREQAEDRRLGEMAAREREHVVEVQRREEDEAHCRW